MSEAKTATSNQQPAATKAGSAERMRSKHRLYNDVPQSKPEFRGAPEPLTDPPGQDSGLEAMLTGPIFRATLEASGHASIIVRPDNTIIVVNRAFEELAGVSREQIEGRLPWTVFVHGDDLARMLAYRKARLAGESAPDEYEFRFLDRNGGLHTINLIQSLITPEGYAAVSVSDVTYVNAAERALMLSELRYRRLAEAARDMIIVTEIDGTISYANGAALSAVGLDSLAPGEANVLEWVPKEYRGEIKRLYARRVAGDHQSYLYETEMMRADGGRVAMEVSSVTLPRPDRNPEVLIVARDISERKAAEQSRDEHQRRMRTMLESAEALIAFYDADDRYTLVNERYAKTFGLTPEELIGKRPEECLPPRQAEFVRPLREQVKRGEKTTFETHLALPGIEPRWYSGTYSPILSPEGEYLGHVVIVLDITEQKEATLTRQTRENLEVARRLARTVAHEFRQPMTALRLIAELATMSEKNRDFALQNLVKVPRLVDRLDELVTRLLDITNLNTRPYLHDLDILDLERTGGLEDLGRKGGIDQSGGAE